MSFEATRLMMDDYYRRLARKERRKAAKIEAKPGLKFCTNHGPKALTNRPVKLERKAIPDAPSRKSRRLRRNRWVPR